jgi:predicted glycoside hydrolase/deacetylase ChbG (UPF0249 family)
MVQQLSTAARGDSKPVRRLCVCADDFGLSEGVNAAVLDLADRGKISATGCLVRRAAWTAGAKALRGVRPDRLAVGLHLDLTWPLTDGAPDQSLSRLIARSYLRLLARQAVRSEIGNQLSRLEDALGRAPAFVDGHRHVHQLPVVRDMLIEELAARYGTALPWIRSTAPAASGTASTKAGLIFSLGGRALLKQAASRRIPTSRGLLGVYDFSGNTDAYRARLRRWINECRDGDVLMCHPALKEMPGDPIGAARRNEYEVLSGIAFPFETRQGTVALAPAPV